jgi:hypothetical protein
MLCRSTASLEYGTVWLPTLIYLKKTGAAMPLSVSSVYIARAERNFSTFVR